MQRLHDSDLRLLLSLIENAIMPEGPAQRDRIRSTVERERQHREFPYAQGAGIWQVMRPVAGAGTAANPNHTSPPGLGETGHERN